jgi:hypothetical protein
METARRVEDAGPTESVSMPYRYFSHEIDSETHYCINCGRFLMELQENMRWVGNEVIPSCFEASNVSAISHMVRGRETPENTADTPPRSFRR